MMEPLLVEKISVVLRVPSVEEAVNFYTQAFGAVECPVPSSPEQELIGIHATKLNILPKFPILITDCPLVPEINPAALNLCLQVRGGQLADLKAAVTRAVNAGATTEGELVLDPRPSMRLKDPYGVVWFLYIPSDDEISSDHRRKCLYLDELPEKPPVEHEDDPNASYLSKLKILLKVPDPVEEEAAVKFYSTAFGAGAPQFPTKNEIPGITSTHLELATNYYIMISGSPQIAGLSSGVNLCARTDHVEELVERLKQGGAVLEGDIVYDDPINKFRQMAKLRDRFGVLWFIYNITLEEALVPYADLLDGVDGDGPTFREIFRLWYEAAREGRKWPAVGPDYFDFGLEFLNFYGIIL
ncbi:hypothetical protein Tsubulata_026115 [Turnera subulata]|uniref:VOC domain-containing protein n=1 Tax=Turnera subulata TaxID=218843 RepID=A0A9Q0F7R3_9ROSI|nr:hypothetical protein Tsubulata_026115 [Turnera subulata]